MKVEIIQGSDTVDLQEIESLRYEIYISEQNKPLPHAQHEKFRLPDSLDKISTHFITRQNNQLIGYGRLTVDTFPNHYLTHAGLQRAMEYIPGKFAYMSNVMVSRQFRQGIATCKLFEAMFRWAVSQGVSVGFCHCARHLTPMYMRLGLVELSSIWRDEHLGDHAVMALVHNDVPRFAALNSPFLAVALTQACGDVSAEEIYSQLDLAQHNSSHQLHPDLGKNHLTKGVSM